ncbi:hypothetical protein PQR70_14205 [Paraburkholderia madseniana]|uniref:hypothetical protein n=1 Tax=Paraburkholderia madseniana TaxID=2599607 RepID=UPI0038B940CB
MGVSIDCGGCSVNVGYLTQDVVDTLREPGEYYDGDATRLELVVSAAGRRRQYRVRSGMGVSRRAERVGAASMYSLDQARVRAARILRDLAAGETFLGSAPIRVLAPRGDVRRDSNVQATAASAAFFRSWVRGR